MLTDNKFELSIDDAFENYIKKNLIRLALKDTLYELTSESLM